MSSMNHSRLSALPDSTHPNLVLMVRTEEPYVSADASDMVSIPRAELDALQA
jgi:hypothetical protein